MTESASAASGFNTGFAASDLAVSRGGGRVLEDVSIALAPGEAAVLRGPNGVGKTTLLRALAGLIRPDCGAIVLRRAGADDPDGDMRAACVYCGVLNAHKAALTVDENLRFWAALYDAPQARLVEARRAFGLDPYAERHAGALSTGLARRLGLARLILAARPIWFVDEPTASLDAASAADFTALVEAHRAKGGVVLIAAHDDMPLNHARHIKMAGAEAA